MGCGRWEVGRGKLGFGGWWVYSCGLEDGGV